MRANEIIIARRQELGLADDEVSRRCGLEYMAYYDIEAYDDEFMSVISVSKAKRICSCLNLDFLEVVAADTGGIVRPSISDSISSQFGSRSSLISRRRQALGLSQEQLAEQTGFRVSGIADVEMDPTVLEQVPIEWVIALAKVLEIPPEALLCAN